MLMSAYLGYTEFKSLPCDSMPVPQAEKATKLRGVLAHVNTVKNLGLNLSLATF